MGQAEASNRSASVGLRMVTGMVFPWAKLADTGPPLYLKPPIPALFLIGQVGPQPLFGFLDAPALAPGVVRNLVLGDPSHREVAAFRMREVEPADAGARVHGIAAGQSDAGGLF